MCAFSKRERPPPLPRTMPTTLGRPGCGSSMLTSRPARVSQSATKRAISPSPGPFATRSGLIELIATNWLKREVISFIIVFLLSNTPRPASGPRFYLYMEIGSCRAAAQPYNFQFLYDGFVRILHLPIYI